MTKPSPRFAEYVRKIKCGEWREVAQKDDAVVIEHIPTGKRLSYLTHDGGNDYNSPRNFALDVQRTCGCRLIEPRGRKKSRKSTAIQQDERVEAQRRKYRAAAEDRRRTQAEQAERAEQDRAEQARADRVREWERQNKKELVRLLMARERARMAFIRNPDSPSAAADFQDAHRAYVDKRKEAPAS